MTTHEVRQLHEGDEVTFVDPDSSALEPRRLIQIRSITILGSGPSPIVSISSDEGELECYPHELE